VRLKIINGNYVYATTAGRLILAPWLDEKPWKVCGSGQIGGFPTFAEAIQYADQLVSGQQETPIVMTHQTTDWDVQVLPQYVHHYLDAGWTIRKGPNT